MMALTFGLLYCIALMASEQISAHSRSKRIHSAIILTSCSCKQLSKHALHASKHSRHAFKQSSYVGFNLYTTFHLLFRRLIPFRQLLKRSSRYKTDHWHLPPKFYLNKERECFLNKSCLKNIERCDFNGGYG
jgi:hypothetical protein